MGFRIIIISLSTILAPDSWIADIYSYEGWSILPASSSRRFNHVISNITTASRDGADNNSSSYC